MPIRAQVIRDEIEMKLKADGTTTIEMEKYEHNKHMQNTPNLEKYFLK